MEEGFDDEIGLAVTLVGRKADDEQTVFSKAGIAPLIGLGGVLMMGAIDFQNAPFALILHEKIHLASLAMAFSIESDFGVSEEQDIFVIQRFGDFDFTLGA